MKRILLVATLTLLLWGTSAFAGNFSDLDLDGVSDQLDNCSEKINASQDDTDADDCGNLCDADYDQSGLVDFGDFGAFAAAFGLSGNTLPQHVEPISPDAPRAVDFGDFGYFASAFSSGPGPSGTTASTVACP
jgi:hypothetical protein